MKKAEVRFISHGSSYKTYYFMTNLADLSEGELVMVESGNTIQIAEFIRYSDTSYEPKKFILFAIDMDDVRLARNSLHEMKRIKKILTTKTQEFAEQNAFNLLLSTDSEAKELYEMYKDLEEELYV